MRKLLILTFFLPVMAWAQSSLPPCPDSIQVIWHQCKGSRIHSDSIYVGRFVNNEPKEEGVLYTKQGNVLNYGSFQYLWQLTSQNWGTDKLGMTKEEWSDRYPFASPLNVATSNQVQEPISTSRQYCPQNGRRHNCFGFLKERGGYSYTGEFQDDKRHGEGVFFFPDGVIASSGKWDQGSLKESYSLDANRFPFNPPVQVAAMPLLDLGKSERDRLAAELQAERSRRQALEDRLASEVRERQRLASIERSRPEQTGDGTPDDQTCRRYGFTVATSPYANCRQQLDMARRQQEQYEQQVAAAEEEARRRRMREFGMRLLQGQQIGEAAMAASGMALPERPRPTSIISPQGPIVCQYYSASRSFVCQ